MVVLRPTFHIKMFSQKIVHLQGISVHRHSKKSEIIPLTEQWQHYWRNAIGDWIISCPVEGTICAWHPMENLIEGHGEKCNKKGGKRAWNCICKPRSRRQSQIRITAGGRHFQFWTFCIEIEFVLSWFLACDCPKMSCFQISQGKKLKVGPRHGGGDEVPGDFALLLEQVHAQQQGGRGALGHLHRVLRHHHHRRLHAGWSSSSILSISLICGFCFVLYLSNIFLCFQAKDGSEPYISWWIFRLPLRKELHSGQTKGLSTLFTWASLWKCNAGVVAVVLCREFQTF